MSRPTHTDHGALRFGEKLRRLRQRRELTLKQLAQALGYSNSSNGYFSELEAGKKKPTVDFVVLAADFFGVTTDQLLRDELDV